MAEFDIDVNNPPITEFDLSDNAITAINDALIRYTIFNRGGNPQNQAYSERRRNTIISTLLSFLRRFNGPIIKFRMMLSQSMINIDKTATLFRQIADTICKNETTDFHFIKHGKPVNTHNSSSKYVIIWNYRHYQFKAYTVRDEETLNYFMIIVDTSKEQNDDADSDTITVYDGLGRDDEGSGTDDEGSGTDDEGSGTDDDGLSIMYNTLKSMHDRLCLLESAYDKHMASNKL